jgi:hypothetical protein
MAASFPGPSLSLPRQLMRTAQAWRDELKRKYPKVGPLGHRDWQEVRTCLGRTVSMRAAFAAKGGHGNDRTTVGGGSSAG